MALRSPSSFLNARILTFRSPYICSSCSIRTHPRYQSTDASVSSSSGVGSDATAEQQPILTSPSQRIPRPTPFVPNVSTFLKLIGRELSQHAAKFHTWEEMFTLTSTQLKARGLEPPRARKYFLRWREKFRRGDYGIGGDLTHVTDGLAELRVCEVPSLPQKLRPAKTTGEAQDETATAAATMTKPVGKPLASTSQTPAFTKLILNVPAGATTYKLAAGQKTTDLAKPKGMKLREGHIIVGSYVYPKAGSHGSAATIKVTEGMWEDRRGHKVHGGERRRAEVLHKLRVAESKKASR